MTRATIIAALLTLASTRAIADDLVRVRFVDAPLREVAIALAAPLGLNLIITDPLDETVTVIVHEPVSPDEVNNIFLSVLASEGYTAVTTGPMTRIVPLN